MKTIFTCTIIFTSLLNAYSQIPTAGLKASYSFNAGNANDEIGTNDGVVTGATLTADRFGNSNLAYELDGVDDYIDFGDTPEFQMGTSDFALSFWYYYDVAQLTQVIGKRGGANNFEQYCFIIGDNLFGVPTAGNTTTGLLRTGGVNRVLVLGDQRGAWHHVVMNHDYDSVSSLFIDGALQTFSSTPISSGLDVSGSSFVVGLFGTSNYYNGKIDDIYIYDRYLADNEILDLYNAENPTSNINENQFKISLFPNPVNDLLVIRLNQPSALKIFSLDGKQVLSTTEIKPVYSIDCSSFPAGIYFIQTENGATQKFIKE
jgi:hypothetical protein